MAAPCLLTEDAVYAATRGNAAEKSSCAMALSRFKIYVLGAGS
jgi:sulfur transfer complex TusBCD TusB component (DsrH family)